MSVLDRTSLEASPLADLHTIASELSIDGYRRLRRDDLIDAIIARQEGAEPKDGEPDGTEPDGGEPDGGEPKATEPKDVAPGGGESKDAEPDAADAAEAGEGEGDDAEDGASAGAAARRRRGRRGGRGRATREALSDRGEDDEEEAEAGDEPEADEEPAEPDVRIEPDVRAEPRSRRARRGGRGGLAATDEDAEAETDEGGEGPLVEGTVELLANGSGFLRVSPPDPSEDDVYISAAQVKRCELVNGDVVAGPKRAPRRSERFASLIRIESINGRPASELADGIRYDDLPAAFPTERFRLGSEDPTLKAIEWLTPFGRGSRVTITGGPWAGKSHALRALADTLASDEVSLFVALAGVRPEEISDWGSASVAPAGAVSFVASTDAQDNVVELVVEQARRLAARGGDAVVLIDSLDGLHPPTARKILAAARNIVDGGSLTVIATSTRPLGGETTVIALDPTLTSTGRFPALDLVSSGTLRPELLVGEAGAKAIAEARAEANG